MIKPTNLHFLIEPLKHDSFILSQKDTYQEIGVVIDADAIFSNREEWIGRKVYFDAWLGKKYPKEGSTTEFYWLIKGDDIVAYEDKVSE